MFSSVACTVLVLLQIQQQSNTAQRCTVILERMIEILEIFIEIIKWGKSIHGIRRSLKVLVYG
jgi:hypothetical protein